MIKNYDEILKENRSVIPEWKASIESLKNVKIPQDSPYCEYFQSLRTTILQVFEFYQILADDPSFTQTPIARLQAINEDYYRYLRPHAPEGEPCYECSYTNPDFAVQHFGKPMGQLLAAISINTYCRDFVMSENYPELLRLNILIMDMIKSLGSAADPYETWLAAYRSYAVSDFKSRSTFGLLRYFSPQNTYYRDIIQKADLGDLRYMYRYGVHISEHDRSIATFMQNYPQEELQALADYIVSAFLAGFESAQKDYKIKKYCTLNLPCGLEKLGRMLIEKLEAVGLYPLISLPRTNGINKQVSYDHRFNSAFYTDEAFVEMSIQSYEEAIAELADLVGSQAGSVYVELFGEEPFNPIPKANATELEKSQMELKRKLSAANSQSYHKYARRHESSFCIIAFPSPEIGERFEEIFADTIKINLLDSTHYAMIQQNIIDILDGADFVHVKGKDGNETDIMVKLHSLNDPATETKFENCVADVNIPVGEVFTSPVLTGTTGILHVEDIYLGNLRYFNIKLHFEDGWIKDYSCTNFASLEENKKYVHENLLLPHQSLPIGEFAIGTNTTAYQMAKKYDIMALLPILIIEKMGPHFAIGDTCFSHEEDIPHPSFVNGKNMVAVENEKSITRKEDPMNAYTNKHMDITLPYEMLSHITAIMPDGNRIDIIRDGFFVVPGTEELNIPLKEMLREV
ncbi:MAG: aminopeptidase [Candidatus Cloacimonadaceae bacterium]|nr:aminopeptidase [Candidatus Cloacimonadaceae bacterium]